MAASGMSLGMEALTVIASLFVLLLIIATIVLGYYFGKWISKKIHLTTTS